MVSTVLFISTNMKFSHIHIITHRRGGLGGIWGKGRGYKGGKWVCYVSTSVENALGRAAKIDTRAKAG